MLPEAVVYLIAFWASFAQGLVNDRSGSHLEVPSTKEPFLDIESLVPRGRRAVERRDVQAGGKCGSANANAVCAAGLCCSSSGICGTGGAFCGAPDCQLSFGPACDGNKVPPGKDTSTVPRPLFGSVPYGVDVSHCSVNGKVALTFDDGPYIWTTDLLDILKKNNVKATFFVVGANGGKGQIEDETTGYPAIIRRMYADGHQIGSHTWSHQDFSLITQQQRRDQVIRNEIALVDILGFFPTYLRPPYTHWTPDALNELKGFGYHVLNYDIDTRDWQGDYNYAQNTYTSILSQHSPTSSSWISLAHDVQNNTVHGFAQYMIDQAKKLGYQLVTVGECLGDPAINWYRDPTTGQPYDAAKAVQVQSSAVPSVAATKTTQSSVPTTTVSKTTVTSASTVKTTTAPVTTSVSSSVVYSPSAVGNANFGGGATDRSSTSTAASILAVPAVSAAGFTTAASGSRTAALPTSTSGAASSRTFTNPTVALIIALLFALWVH